MTSVSSRLRARLHSRPYRKLAIYLGCAALTFGVLSVGLYPLFLTGHDNARQEYRQAAERLEQTNAAYAGRASYPPLSQIVEQLGRQGAAAMYVNAISLSELQSRADPREAVSGLVLSGGPKQLRIDEFVNGRDVYLIARPGAAPEISTPTVNTARDYRLTVYVLLCGLGAFALLALLCAEAYYLAEARRPRAATSS